MRPKLAPQPRTRATTPIGILKSVAKAILEEPKRYDQSDWGERVIPEDDYDKQRLPACGTVACVAGWVDVLTRPKTKDAVVGFGGSERRARRKLKLQPWQARELFDGGAVYGREGTKAYARAGVRHIEQFMREHMGYKGGKL